MRKGSTFLLIAIAAFCFKSCGKSDILEKEATSIESKDLDLVYHIGNRWRTITKERISKATSLNDVIKEDYKKLRVEDYYQNVTISVLHNDKDVRDIKIKEMGQSMNFNAAQKQLLKSCDYSTNLRITFLSHRKKEDVGKFQADSSIIYLTVVPENEAVFDGGFNALTNYLKDGLKEASAIIEKDKVQPSKVFFTVDENGTIGNVKIVETSGYPSVDDELIKVISNMPCKWQSATDVKGHKVHQEFVFSFGSMGC